MLWNLGVPAVTKYVGSITLQPLDDVIVLVILVMHIGLDYSVIYIWLGHDTITTMGSLVVKGLLNHLWAHIRRTGITVWLGLSISA